MKPKIVRKRNWLFEMIILVEIAIFPVVWYLILKDARQALLVGGITYLALAWTLRLTVNRHHRRGVRCLKKQQYEEALGCFIRSEAFFTRYPWVDHFRVLTLFTSSAFSFREMALQNQVHSLLHLNRPAEAIAPLERLLTIAPGRSDVAELHEKLQEYLAQQTVG